MKTLFFTLVLFLSNIATYSQTYKSSYLIKPIFENETDKNARTITLTDNVITITNFLEKNTKTLTLYVYKIENKEWGFDGIQKTYYCNDKDKDVIDGNNRKVIVYKTSRSTIKVASFADEITVYVYEFGI
jgi:hypothetical protein